MEPFVRFQRCCQGAVGCEVDWIEVLALRNSWDVKLPSCFFWVSLRGSGVSKGVSNVSFGDTLW